MPRTQKLYVTSLTLYVLFLLWLVLFKFSAEPLSVLAHYGTRSLNLLPFGAGTVTDVVENFMFFIPLGLLLGINFKQKTLWQKLAYVGALSVAMEIAQFVFAIGATDITDVITNTLGGLAGLATYDLAAKYSSNKKLDLFIIVAIAILITIFTMLRFLVFRVRY